MGVMKQHICKIRKLDEWEIAMIGGFVYSFGMVKFRFKDGKVLALKDIRRVYDVEYIAIRDLYYYTGIISGLVKMICETLNNKGNEGISDTIKNECEILNKIAVEWIEILVSSGLDEFAGLQHIDILLPDTY